MGKWNNNKKQKNKNKKQTANNKKFSKHEKHVNKVGLVICLCILTEDQNNFKARF